MIFRIWGVRGTIPVSSPDKQKYGGHTTCVSFKMPGEDHVIIDAGTGIRELGKELSRKTDEPLVLHLLFTHFHLDHIIGFPTFPPLYMPNVILNIYSPISTGETERNIKGLMSGRYYPIEFDKTPCKKIFTQIPMEPFLLGGLKISCCPLRHPQGSVAYKLESGGKTVVFATDTEHPNRGIDEELAEFAHNTDILVYDATYTPEEYAFGRKGWGHSTWKEGVRLAKAAEVRNLYLFHFNPDHFDQQVDEIVELAKEKFPRTKGAREESSLKEQRS